jgi:hypothetical protein
VQTPWFSFPNTFGLLKQKPVLVSMPAKTLNAHNLCVDLSGLPSDIWTSVAYLISAAPSCRPHYALHVSCTCADRELQQAVPFAHLPWGSPSSKQRSTFHRCKRGVMDLKRIGHMSPAAIHFAMSYGSIHQARGNLMLSTTVDRLSLSCLYESCSAA